MINKDLLKNYANKLMFDMEDNEYETLQNEFDVILKQMDLIAKIDGISNVKPLTFPFPIDDVILRDDESVKNIKIEDALSNAKDRIDREVKVPKVVE